ncbi:hypothetical protein N9J72_00315 [Candidatus Gracilibacteria bacterium]|nr:hypothetical protein [Candidatus Gracilibacteria bacterium]
MKKILSGNLDRLIEETPQTRGWFLGKFMQDNPDYLSQKIEIKWVNEKRGHVKPGLSSSKNLKTYAILVSGKMKVCFNNTQEEVLLEKQGDYVYFDTSYSDHTSYVLEDCTLLAIRWEEE